MANTFDTFVFRSSRPANPVHPDHLIRHRPTSDSGASRPPNCRASERERPHCWWL